MRIASGITNGEITADKRAAVQNEIVTLTVKPAYGYELETLTVRDANDQDIPVTENTFTMPDADVTVSAVFKAISLSIGGVYTVPEGGASFLTLTLTGDTTILLTEGATLTVPGEINGENCTLTIQGTGTLDLCSENGGMHVKKLTIDSGRINGTITVSGENGVTITGGKIEGDISAERISISGGEIRGELVATGENGITITGGKVETDYIDSVYGVAICGGSVSGGSIYSSGSISISGGETTDSQIDGKTVNITSGVVSGSITGERISISGGKIRGSIVASSESGVSIIGGQVNAEYGISGWYAGGLFPLTLGCTLGNDYIYSDYYSYCSISIAKGQTLTDGVNLYTGTLTEEQISELPEKTLRRAYAIMIPESTAGGTVMADKGFVDPDDPDKSVTIIVTPDKGYALDTLTYTPADGTATDIIANAQGQYTFQMPAAIVTVTATFTPIDYTITKNAEHGSITARVGEDGDDADTAHYGETVTLTIAPDEDYTLDTLTVGSIDKTALVSDNQFSFTMPDTDLTVTAVFKPKFGTPDFVMPADLTMIEISAFEGNTKMTVVDARHCTTIGKDAFNGCTGLKQIRLPQNCTIHADAFTGCGTVFVFAPADGTTQTFCDDPNRTNLIFVPEMAGQ